MKTWIWISVSVLAIGCNKKSSGPDPLADVSGFCEEWAKRACNATVVTNCAATDAVGCINEQAVYCESLVPDEGKYSEAGAAACLDAVAAAYTDAVLTATERDTVEKLGPPCDQVLSGSGEAGDTCSEDSDCDRPKGLSCVVKTIGSAGTCQTPMVVGGGLDCSSAAAMCDTGFYCSSDSHCIEGSTAGKSCSATLPCDADSQCLTADGKPPGSADGGGGSATCRARKSTGGACQSDDDCVSQICEGATASAAGVCTATIILSPTDPTCKNLRSPSASM